MAAKAERVVGLVEISGAEHEFCLTVALEAGARSDVKNTIGAVAELRAVASTIDFEIINVLGIELRAEVGGNIGVGDGHAIEEPTGLVAAADVELVVREVSAGNVVGDHGETVGARGTGSVFDVETAHQSDGSGGVSGSGFGDSGDVDDLLVRGHVQRKMQDGLRSGTHSNVLRSLIEGGSGHGYGVIAERDAIENELAGRIGGGAGGPVRSFGAQ